MNFLKKRKLCIPALLVLVFFPLTTNIVYFHKNSLPFNFINFLKVNFSEPLLIIVSILSFLIAFILCSLTQLKQEIDLEKELKKVTQPFKILLDNAPAAVIATDNKGIITYVNKAFEETIGYSRDDLVNKRYGYEFYKGKKETAKEIMRKMRSSDYGGIGRILNYEVITVTRYKEEIPCLLYGNINFVNDKEDGTIGFLVDMRERLKILEQLKKSHEQYRSLIENAGEGIYIRQDHQFKYFNKKFKEMLGYADDKELKSLPIIDVIDSECFERCSEIYDKILKGKNVKNPYESIFKKKDGSKIHVEISINLVDYNGKPAAQGFVRDITIKKELEKKLQNMNEKLLELSITDELTGLYNYRYFKNKLKEKYLESKRYKIPLSLLIIDIDDFKKINDKFGHLAGDLVLKSIANVLQRNVRDVDIVARYGGEEFAILLPYVDIEKAKEVARRILLEIDRKEFIYDINTIIKVTVSIGISSFYEQIIKSENDLIKFADEAMYYVKNTGKNNIKEMEFNIIN